jgi:hypothetical protein
VPERSFIDNFKENIIDQLKDKVLNSENIIDSNTKIIHPYKSKILNDFNVYNVNLDEVDLLQ